jgi:hypothetical protein
VRAARVRFPKALLLQLLHLPQDLAIEAHPVYSTSRPQTIEFFLEGEALGAAFEVPEGDMIPEALLEYQHDYDAESATRTYRLLSMRRV